MSWKEYLAKYFTNLISALTLLGVVLLVYTIYENREKDKAERLLLEERYGKLVDQKEDFKKLTETTVQLAVLYKEQAELAKDVALMWKDLAVESGERVKLQTKTEVTVEGATEDQPKSDVTGLTAEGLKDYTINELRIAGKDSPALGFILVKNDGSVVKKNYKFEIRVESVQLKDDLTGKIRVVSRAFLIPLENGLAENKDSPLKKWKDQKFSLNITGGEVVVDPQEPLVHLNTTKNFIPWTFNFNGGFGLFADKKGTLDTKPTIGTNLAGWGYSKQDLDWKFAEMGMNYSKLDGVGFHVMPFSYRPFGKYLTNTYVGPGYFVANESQGYFLGLSVGF